MIVETKHLRMVLAVAAHGSLTKAGRELFLSQPALSQQLLLFERRIGTPLFHREGKRMILTGAGARMAASAHKVIAELEELESDIQRLAAGHELLLRVGTQCYSAFHWLPALMTSYARQYPAVDVQIIGDAALAPERALLEGRIDLGILNRPGTDARLAYSPLFEDEMVVVMRPDHRLANRPFVTAEELAQEHLFTYAAPPGHGIVMERLLRPAGLRPRRVTEVQWTDAITAFVKAGMGVAVLARWAIASQLGAKELRARRLTETGFHRRWFAAQLHSAESPPHVRAFIAALARGPALMRRRKASRN